MKMLCTQMARNSPDSIAMKREAWIYYFFMHTGKPPYTEAEWLRNKTIVKKSNGLFRPKGLRKESISKLLSM